MKSVRSKIFQLSRHNRLAGPYRYQRPNGGPQSTEPPHEVFRVAGRQFIGIVARLTFLGLAIGFLITDDVCFGQQASFETAGTSSIQSYGVSADGRFVVGHWLTGNGKGFIWDTTNGSVEELPPLAGGSCFATAVSNDGSVVVGRSTDLFDNEYILQAVRWQNRVPTGLGKLDNNSQFPSIARGVSADGSVVVGSSPSTNAQYQEAFRWQGTMIGLGDFPGGEFESEANGVSSNGSIIVGGGTIEMGGNRSRGFRHENGLMVPLEPPPGHDWSKANGLSADGRFAVGYSLLLGDIQTARACRWDGTTLLSLGGNVRSHANDVSANGCIVVGNSNNNGVSNAMIWDEETGIRDFQQVLEFEFGLDLEGLDLRAAVAVSDDGSVIVGWGQNLQGDVETWRAVIPPTPTAMGCWIPGRRTVSTSTAMARLISTFPRWGPIQITRTCSSKSTECRG